VFRKQVFLEQGVGVLPIMHRSGPLPTLAREYPDMLKRLHIGAEMKSIFVGVALVAVTAFFAFLAMRNPDFSMPDPAKVATLMRKRPQCEATVKDMVENKLIVSIERDGETTINVAVDSTAWSHLPGTARSAAALAVYCAKMPDDGLLIVALRNKVTTQLVWLMVNGRDERSRRELSGD
jgi:hypothetical protein